MAARWSFATIPLLVVACVVLEAAPSRAGVLQLFAPTELGSGGVTVAHTATVDLLPSPHEVVKGDRLVTFILADGDWRRVDEGVNVLSDFAPGTHLLYTNNNNGFDLQGQGSIGGLGSGPAEVTFSEGVRAVGFRAQTQVLGSETLTFSVFNDAALLGTFAVSRVNGQRQDNSASFLGARATDGDLITRVAISSVVVQNGVAHENDFFLGPVTFVPEPGIAVLLGMSLIGVGIRQRRRAPASGGAD